jgi:hypothetical protein
LNVWTPAKSQKDCIPVLVWIYGGGFAAGATSEPVYSGEKLAKKGVVLVSIAYRVGQLGFLAHPELSAETTNRTSGNYGLLDMIAGLQWVRQNIAKRGDPNGEGIPAWPAFSNSNPQVMYFSQTPHPGPVPSAESVEVLDAYFAWRRTPEGEAWAKYNSEHQEPSALIILNSISFSA